MKSTIKEIINEVLSRMETLKVPNTIEARELIFETGNAETGYRHLEQMGGGPSLSFWQLESNTIQDIWDNYISYRTNYIQMAYELGLRDGELDFCVMSNIALAVFFTRVYYRRQPGAIPLTPEERADYWKQYYNTEGGKGTVKHYLEANV